MKTVKSILGKIASALLTEAVIKSVILWGLKAIVASTSNKVDDELIKVVESALDKK